MAKNMGWLKPLTLWLTVVGALNWGFVGLFNFNLVSTIFGTALFTTIVYSTMGISAVIFSLYEMKIMK